MKSWEELERACQSCRGCSLWESRTQVVFGSGTKTGEVLFIGEGPGENEDHTGQPFVGRGGQLLDDMLGSIGLDRRDVYITNIVKCRPPRNRDPLGVEADACMGFLRGQTALLRPKIVVCLGRIAAMRVIDPDFKISQDHGQWYERNGVFMTALYHPAALLRDPRRRPETFQDLLGLREKIQALCDHTPLAE